MHVCVWWKRAIIVLLVLAGVMGGVPMIAVGVVGGSVVRRASEIHCQMCKS